MGSGETMSWSAFVRRGLLRQGRVVLRAAGRSLLCSAVVLVGVSILPQAASAVPTTFESTAPELSYMGLWSDVADGGASGGSYRLMSSGVAYVPFTGTSVSLVSKKGPSFGIMSVSVDGGTANDVDLYDRTGADQQTVWSSGALSSGAHRLRIEWTGRKNKKASSDNINLDAMSIEGQLGPRYVPLEGVLFGNAVFTSETVWHITGDLAVSPGASLTIEAGTVVKFDSCANLTAIGPVTIGSGAFLTSDRDDSHGGDTNLDGASTTPQAGDWGALQVYGGTQVGAANVLYGGFGLDPNHAAAIRVLGGQPQISGAIIRNSVSAGIDGASDSQPSISGVVVSDSQTGVRLWGGGSLSNSTVDGSDGYGCELRGSGSVTGCSIADSAKAGVYVGASGFTTVTGNTITGSAKSAIELAVSSPQPTLTFNSASGNDLNGIELVGSVPSGITRTLVPTDLPYVLYYRAGEGSWSGGISVRGTLQIAPGTIVKSGWDWDPLTQPWWELGGDAHIIVDSGGSLLLSGAPGQRITFTSLKNDNAFGDTNGDGSSSSPSRGDWGGIRVEDGHVDAYSVDFSYSYDWGAVDVSGSGSTLSMNGCTTRAGLPLRLRVGGSGSIRYSDFFQPAGWLVMDVQDSGTVDARYNYWGRAEGPDAYQRILSNGLSWEPWARTPYSKTPGGPELGYDTPCGSAGEPVNTSTGNYYSTSADLVLPGNGPEMAFRRTYNSLASEWRSALGYGWTHEYNLGLRFDPEGAITVVYPSGRQETFAASETAGFVAPPGVTDRLVPGFDGTYELVRLDRTADRFGATGQLESRVDKFGNTLAFSYDYLGRLDYLEGSGGRYFDLDYDEQGNLVVVSDNASRTVEFAYDDQCDLVGATDVNGGMTLYGYDDEHRIVSAASPEHPDDPFLRNLYDAARVTEQ